MFFTDAQKLIFTSTVEEPKKFDPLALDRALRKASNNRLGYLIETWKAVDTDEGDISVDGRLQTVLESDKAEEALANIAREVFGLSPFPDCTDGVALEYLCEYLDWCKKKEMTDTTQQDYSTLVVEVPTVSQGTLVTNHL